MLIRLFVRKRRASDEPEAYLFEDEVIAIGRGRRCHLTLPDPDCILGRQHAEVRRVGTAIHLVDLDSKNGTYLAGQQLKPHKPYPLHEGAVFQLGDYEILFDIYQPGKPTPRFDVADAGQNGVAGPPAYANPFTDEVQALADVLARLMASYDDAPADQRAAALEEALAQALARVPPSEVTQRLGAWLQPGSHVTPEPSADEPYRQVVEALLPAVAQVAAMPAQFRYEFLGQTIVNAPEVAFLFDRDHEALRAHLLAPDLTEAERQQRLAAVQIALDELARHQVALLEGYRASAHEGAHHLATALDPEAKVEQASQSGALYRLLPLLARAKAMDELLSTYAMVAEGDWSAAERRYYRPAFIRAYLARLAETAAPYSFADS